MKVSLDHYVGREVKAVKGIEAHAEAQEAVWEIVLEGDVAIVNYDDDYDTPDDALIGMKLETVVFDAGSTILHFGTRDQDGELLSSSKMHLDPMQYGINDPNREDIEGTVRPQATPFDPETPEHPDERVAEEPEEAPSPDAEQAAEGTPEAEGGTEQGQDV